MFSCNSEEFWRRFVNVDKKIHLNTPGTKEKLKQWVALILIHIDKYYSELLDRFEDLKQQPLLVKKTNAVPSKQRMCTHLPSHNDKKSLTYQTALV
ncbi:hypothetical protein J6590_008345 [Homalodisca vitripennis]|nr:hypothetical protein J6590_008345 [Homalodisca vitripennis]